MINWMVAILIVAFASALVAGFVFLTIAWPTAAPWVWGILGTAGLIVMVKKKLDS